MDTDLILLEHFIRRHPMQAAQTLEGFQEEEIAAFMEAIPAELAVRLAGLMNVYTLTKCLKRIKAGLAAEILEKNDFQRTELLLRQADEALRAQLLGLLSPNLSLLLREKLEYPAYTVGARMLPLELPLREDMAVQDVVNALKGEKGRKSSNLYVVSRDGALAGAVSIHDLLLADDAGRVSDIMKTGIPKFFAGLPAESVTDHPGWYEHLSIPVVDGSDKLIGTLSLEAARKGNAETGEELAKHIMETGSALGELYRIGLAAFLQSVSKGD